MRMEVVGRRVGWGGVDGEECRGRSGGGWC